MQLKTAYELIEEIERVWYTEPERVGEIITQDKADIRAVLREGVINKIYYELESGVAPSTEFILKRIKDDILTLIDTLLPGDVSK